MISTFFKDHCDLTTLKENVAEALQKLIELDVVFARYTPFLVDERYKKLLKNLCYRLSSELLIRRVLSNCFTLICCTH